MAGRLSGGNVFVGNRVSADYCLSTEVVYRHNPYIEALPPVYTSDSAARRMRRRPKYDEAERRWPAEARLQAVQTIANYVEPLPIHTELERRFSRMIRNGYMPRNPISTEWKKQIRAGFPDIDWGTADDNYTPVIRSTAAGFHIIGTSGVGKSTAVESVLSLYPQVIIHTEYNGYSFDRAQLVWLKLECPYDGSLKGLCLNFFQAIDQILETRYYQKFGNSRRTVDELIPNMAYLAAVLGLGVLVVDEIQRLSEAKSGGAARMLNFFVQLANTIGVPVVLVGTFKALPLVTREFALARRGSGQGDLIWSHFAKDQIWDFFIEGLWDYQWTNVPTPFTLAFSQALYDESQGIVDIAVKLYMITQWSVIGDEDETITPGSIRKAAAECLQSARPILEALRLKDYQRLSTITDIHPPIANLDEYFQQANQRVTIEGTLNTLRNQRRAEQNVAAEDPDSNPVRIASWLVEAGFSPRIARECAVRALDRHGSARDLKPAMQEAFLLATNKIGANKDDHPGAKAPYETGRKRKSPTVSLAGDLREIVAKGKKNGIPAYEALKEAGIIKPADEFLAV